MTKEGNSKKILRMLYRHGVKRKILVDAVSLAWISWSLSKNWKKPENNKGKIQGLVLTNRRIKVSNIAREVRISDKSKKCLFFEISSFLRHLNLKEFCDEKKNIYFLIFLLISTNNLLYKPELILTFWHSPVMTMNKKMQLMCF